MMATIPNESSTFAGGAQIDRFPVRTVANHQNLGVVFLIVLAGALISSALVMSSSFERFSLLTIIVISIITPLLFRAAIGKVDMFEPIIPLSVALLAMFFLRPLADEALNRYDHLGYDIASTFDRALLVAAVGCIFINAGYSSKFGISIGNKLPIPTDVFPTRRAVLAAIFMSVLATALFGYFLATSGGLQTLALFFRGRSTELETVTRASTGYLLDSRFLLMPASLIFFAIHIRCARFVYAALAIASGLPLIVIETSLGNRSTLLPMIFGAVSIFYLYRRRRPSLLLICAFCISSLTASSLLRENRTAASDYEPARAGEAGTPIIDTALETFTESDDEMFDTLANVLSIYPSQKNFRPMALVTDAIVRGIPRVWMKDKPLESNDEFIVAMWPDHYRKSRGSAACSILGAFYIYGGIPGVAILSYLFGAVLNGLWIWYRRTNKGMNAILLYAFVPALTIVLLRGTIPDTLARAFFTAFPLWIAVKYWSLPDRS